MAVHGDEFAGMGTTELVEWIEGTARKVRHSEGIARDIAVNELAAALPEAARRLVRAERPPTPTERAMAVIWACQRMERALFDHLDREPCRDRVKTCQEALSKALWNLTP